VGIVTLVTILVFHYSSLAELLEQISLESRAFQHDIDLTLRQSYKDRAADKLFHYTKCQLVHNETLLKQVYYRYNWVLYKYPSFYANKVLRKCIYRINYKINKLYFGMKN
jgi:hypothetical protein